MHTTVEATQLVKRFGAVEAVRGVSFSIDAGQCFGFLGPNGAGKTTTMRMIGCTSPVGGGTLRVLGMHPQTDARAIKQRLGVVPQDDNSDHYLTVYENIELYGRYFGLHGPGLTRRVNDVLEFVRLRERTKSIVRELSGGMRRRLLIARSLINDPQVIILDEPTVGLDPQARHLLWERLRVLRQEKQRTLILSTHYMDEAEQLCDTLVIMDSGTIIASGAPRDLIAQHVSREVVEWAAPRADLQALGDWATQQGLAHELLYDRILLFCERADALLPRVAARTHDTGRLMARRSSLEDVYLKLTGRSLAEVA